MVNFTYDELLSEVMLLYFTYKRGEPSKEALATELSQTIVDLFRIAVYDLVEKEFEDSINKSNVSHLWRTETKVYDF